MKLKYKWPIILAAVLVVGFLWGRNSSPDTEHRPVRRSLGEGGTLNTTPSKTAFWTCSMHPEIQLPNPGQCPKCGMDLIPVTEDAGETKLGPRELKLSPAARKRASVETAPAERRFVTREVRMVGKVEFDETRMAYITARVPGRLDRLYVDYTGVPVRKGDHLVYLYSPELLAAQEELIQAIQTVEEIKLSENSFIRERARATVDASREKLRLWGLTDEQIRDIEARKASDDHLTIFSPVSGIVIHKNALEGMYVETGTRIYTIADLTQVWLKLDAYESDLSWIHYGQELEFTTEAYPGEPFAGTIAFIDPVLNENTRTVKVRVNVENSDGKLKPGMFVRATVRSRLALGGKVMDPDLAGKLICPMHPEVIKDAPGDCDICGMPLVATEDFGYLPAESANREAPLVIPATAPLLTGKRAVVYVEKPGDEGVYEGREIVLGSRAGDDYIVDEGLSEGERVVVNGAFKIDSAIQILAKPSMMNPVGVPPSSRSAVALAKEEGGSSSAASADAKGHNHQGH